MIKYIILISILFIGLIMVELNRKKPIDWTPTYINVDKSPYGTYIVFKLLKDVFPNSHIRESRLPIYNKLDYIYENDIDEENISESYLFINNTFGASHSLRQTNNFGVDKLDVKKLLTFVSKGNNVFISAQSITSLLLDSLDIKIKTDWESSDSTYIFNEIDNKKYSFSSINGALYYFSKSDTSKIKMQVLAQSMKNSNPVFVSIKYGDGFIYLNSLPVAFSNLELLNLDKYDFAFKCLSYLPISDNIIWDEYQKQGQLHQKSVFRVMLNHSALRWACCVVLILAILFMIFRSKRKQRIIPAIEPPKNTSLEFLDTISNLYYQKQAYESIVEKRHNYFLDMIRTKYYLSTEKIDEEFVQNLSRKSGVNLNIIESIFNLYNEIDHSYNISNNILLKYNERLEEFYQKMK